MCLEHECAVRLKEVLWGLSPLSPEIVKEGSIDVASLGEELMGLTEETAFTAIAGGIGLQVNQFASLLGSIVLYLSINSTLKRNLGSVAAILLTTIKVPCEKLYWKL